MPKIPDGFWEDASLPMPTIYKYVTVAVFLAQASALLSEQEKLGEFYWYSVWMRVFLCITVAIVFFACYREPEFVRRNYRWIGASWVVYTAINMTIFQYWSYEYITTQYFYIGIVQVVIGLAAIFPLQSKWMYAIILFCFGIYLVPHTFLVSKLPDHYEQIQYSGLVNFAIVAVLIHHVYMYIRVISFNQKVELNERQKKIDLQNKKLDEQNAELEKLNKELGSINETKDKFFSLIAHDLRGPISSFKMGMDIISDKNRKFNEKERKKFIDVMKNSSKNVLDLLENLLFWSKSERGIIDFTPKAHKLNGIVNECFLIVKTQADRKGVALTVSIDEDLEIVCDKNMLTTIIRNLLSNAVKFTPKSGWIIVKVEDNKSDFVFSINDSGVGMSNEELNQLFRLSANRTNYGTDGEKGNGLGLILCKEFIEKHGGELSIESTEGIGTSVSFNIPKPIDQ